MAKYSTGNGGGDDGGGACELCGTVTDRLSTATVAGARLQVCPDCSSHGEPTGTGPTGNQSSSGQGSSGQRPSDKERKQRAVENTAKAKNVWDGDSSHWESEGTNYDDDPLPYLVSNYGEQVTAARQDLGLRQAELADELSVPETDLLAVEQGRANRAGVGGSLISALEDRLDVTLSEG